MIRMWWRLCRGYRLRPWRSPYLRWRIETYWGIPAESIAFADFWRFVWRNREELQRYARWARAMESRTGGRILNQEIARDRNFHDPD